MHRRDFLTLSTTSLGATLLTQCSSSRSNPITQNASPIATTVAAELYQSQNGQLDLALEARPSVLKIGNQSSDLLSYSGRIPGPRIEAKPGDRVRLKFRNALASPTNLHFHGLHIPPTRPADNPFLRIAPGDQTTYEFTIPQDHPSVTAYYHPHLHGYVAQQIFGGLGGIFVVRGALDQIPEVQAAQEEFLFLKDFDLSQNFNSRSGHMGMQMIGREGNVLTINGQIAPRIKLTKGLLRLRIVNASTSRFYRLALEKHSLYLIATDAGAIEQPRELSELLLSPGERAEVLIKADQGAGQYRLLNLPYERAAMGMGRGMMGRGMMGEPDNRSTTNVLATLSYEEDVQPQALPDKLIPVSRLAKPSTQRQFTMNHGMAPGQGMVFLINGRPFAPDRVDTQVKLGSVEDWEIINTGVMDHPFHLHTNRFQIIEQNGQPVATPMWKDTVLVKTGESVKIRVAFQDYPGKTVYHCHILDHEDLGMMGIIEMMA
ncbi:multicopper oxidase family protein [filamentous cyanobacterium LEGE 11480]|uniref:Multicopper oxidase family protein n=1 Tax=Romeriopsis navalis LEGE 11480 TaxID=2777977 RepID=A0A928VKX6_9CYAN|nr:multicopper oxidase family protein [Romeriopsis navalis]MBE9030456.1 multicopper oxidase family protein [Romeriopsis navalis LEGE 11480]